MGITAGGSARYGGRTSLSLSKRLRGGHGVASRMPLYSTSPRSAIVDVHGSVRLAATVDRRNARRLSGTRQEYRVEYNDATEA